VSQRLPLGTALGNHHDRTDDLMTGQIDRRFEPNTIGSDGRGTRSRVAGLHAQWHVPRLSRHECLPGHTAALGQHDTLRRGLERDGWRTTRVSLEGGQRLGQRDGNPHQDDAEHHTFLPAPTSLWRLAPTREYPNL